MLTHPQRLWGPLPFQLVILSHIPCAAVSAPFVDMLPILVFIFDSISFLVAPPTRLFLHHPCCGAVAAVVVVEVRAGGGV